MIEREEGAAEMLKSGTGFIVSETGAVWESVPLVPVIVRLNVPAVVEVVVVTVIVLVPAPPVMGDGLKLAEAPAGRPLAARLTAPVKPFRAATVTV
jgi:hypothetical protein